MIVLGIDTACSACAAALWRDGDIIARHSREMMRGHAEALMPMITGLLADTDLSYSEIDRIGVTTGPGSFTGVRTGLAAARGLALGLGVPLIGITTLRAVARSAFQIDGLPPKSDILIILETRRRDFFVQQFGGNGQGFAPHGEPAALDAGEILAMMAGVSCAVVGDGAARFFAELGADAPTSLAHLAGVTSPDAGDVAALAAVETASPGDRVQPVYIHPPQAALPPGGGQVRP